MRLRLGLMAFAMFFWSEAASARPLIFVQAKLTLIAGDDGGLKGVMLDWLYDSAFTHLLAHEIGADEDETMQLSPEEVESLRALVLDWPPEFSGDLVVTADGVDVPILPRTEPSMTFEFGHIREKHTRILATDLPSQAEVVIKLYDPYYYTAYAVIPEVDVMGTLACPVSVLKADMDVAHDFASSLLGGRQVGEITGDEDFPPIGEVFSDSIIIKCVSGVNSKASE